jgi:hypothetical protein
MKSVEGVRVSRFLISDFCWLQSRVGDDDDGDGEGEDE